jgi:hypothetical protein
LLSCAVLSEAAVQHEDKRQVVEAWLLFWQSAFVTRRHTFSEGD